MGILAWTKYSALGSLAHRRRPKIREFTRGSVWARIRLRTHWGKAGL